MNRINAKKYIGMANTMKCGMKATIIAYRGCADIDIQFEDGTVRTNVTTGNFKKGNINNPQINKSLAKAKDCIGQTRIMNCGMKATVIAY